MQQRNATLARSARLHQVEAFDITSGVIEVANSRVNISVRAPEAVDLAPAVVV
jgi:hypothetical protein